MWRRVKPIPIEDAVLRSLIRRGAMAIAAPFAAIALGAAAPTLIADVDLAKPFDTASPWRITVTQGPGVAAADTASGGAEPGEIRLCLRKTGAAPCDSQLRTALRAGATDDYFTTPHYLDSVKIVRGATGRPLLLVRTSSVHAGDGGQLVLTQALAYRRRADAFVRVYEHATGTNNNEAVRFIEAGPLKGDFISVEPTETAPFGYWVTISNAAPAGAYRQVLRYRSATRYGDGNRLSVIDSEMANIQRRLGLWRPGAPLPLPAGRCATPHLIRMELWCE